MDRLDHDPRISGPHVRAVALAALAVTLAASVTAAASPTTRRVSVSSAGDQSDSGRNWRPSISGNGRFTSFASEATNLVIDDTNGTWDIFVRDRKTKTTTRISERSNGDEADGASGVISAMSTNGRYIAFSSSATNLVGSDTNGQGDVFVHDRVTQKTKRVSVRSNGKQAKNGSSSGPAISGNGRYVAYESTATNLVNGDTNGEKDIFVYDRKTKKTRRVNVRSNGRQAFGGFSREVSISDDGRYVAFTSEAKNLVKGDTNALRDIFVHDRRTMKTRRVNLRSNGKQAKDGISTSASISQDGRYVAFSSRATNLVKADTNGQSDIFVRDRRRGRTIRMSLASNGAQADGGSDDPRVSASGRWVAFETDAINLVASDTNGAVDILVRDRKKKKTRRVSVMTNGAEATGGAAFHPDISADGRFVAFGADLTDLVPNDTNGSEDIFRRGPLR